MRTLYLIVAAAVLVEIASSTNNTISCCAGNDVDDSSYNCDMTQSCGRDDFQCGIANLQFDDQKLNSRGCFLSEICSNGTKAYEVLLPLLPNIRNDSGINNNSLLSSLEIICCDAENCNGVSLVNKTTSIVFNVTDNVTNNATNNVTNNATSNETNNETNNETTANDNSAELSCCSGTVVGDSTTPSSCDATALCSRNDDKCGTVQVQFGDQTAVFRGCLPSESCRNATEAYESAEEYFLTGGLNASQARPEDVVCCDTANCNGAGITKGKSFNVCFVVFMVLS